jgi:c-di-GMP-binding flagellar brake protein YcgR
VFVYANSYGRFRFSAKCLAVKGNQATFELPKTIATLKRYDGAQKRATVRLDTTLPAAWRYVSLGKGNGEFARASLTDLSRTGLSLIIDRELTKGTQVEVRFTLNSASAPVLVLGEVVRASKIEKSGKVSHGLRFHGVGDAVDRAIMEFINKRQTERRNRGLA